MLKNFVGRLSLQKYFYIKIFLANYTFACEDREKAYDLVSSR